MPNEPTSLNVEIEECPIWTDFPAKREKVEDDRLTVLSHRAGGRYRISPDAIKSLAQLNRRNGRIKDTLTTWLVDQRRYGIACPEVTSEVVAYAAGRRMLSIIERADRLLTHLADQAYELGWRIEFTETSPQVRKALGYDAETLPDSKTNFANLLAYAATESDDWDAVKRLLDYLVRRSWVELVADQVQQQGIHTYEVTVEGYAKVEEITGAMVSDQVFVAMWFDPSMDEAYEKGIEPAIKAAGFSAKVINRDPTVDKIDDAIIAEIRRSKFIVADFTQGVDGARGGVYFEAGFAKGLSIPVIFVCRSDMVDKLHFDTRQYNHIVWSDPDNLRQQLRERIQARIT